MTGRWRSVPAGEDNDAPVMECRREGCLSWPRWELSFEYREVLGDPGQARDRVCGRHLLLYMQEWCWGSADIDLHRVPKP